MRRRLRTLPPPRLALVAVGLLACLPWAATAQLPLVQDEFERIDVIAIEVDGRELFAFDALTGRRALIRLELGEEVWFERSRGRIGVVLTDRRLLGVSTGTGWVEARFLLNESVEGRALVEDRLALLVSDRRALAFTGGGGWIEEGFTPEESAEALRAGSAVGVVATNRRVLGIAPGLGGFVTERLRVREGLESLTAQDTLATLRTARRILVFSAPRATWSEQKRKIN